MQAQKTTRNCLGLQLQWTVTEQRDGELMASLRVLSSAGAKQRKPQRYSTGDKAEAGPIESSDKSLLFVPLLCNVEQWLKPAPGIPRGRKHLPMTLVVGDCPCVSSSGRLR